MDSSQEKEKTSADPFAGDIFADPRAEGLLKEEVALPEKAQEPTSWSRHLRKAATSKTDWNKLHRNLPIDLIDELPRGLMESLSNLLNAEGKTIGELLFVNEREINRPEEIPIINPDSWWLTAAIENSSAEIYLEIGNVFAGWLVDAIINEKVTGKAAIRQLTESETAVLEFTALQLTHEANQILKSPIFKYRSLRHQIPTALKKKFEAEIPSFIAADWQIVYGRQTSLVKIYVLPESLQALQPDENNLLDSPAYRSNWSRYQTKAESLRTRINFGQSELSFAELAALEKNDIVLLEKLPFSFRNSVLSGQAEVFVGDGDNITVFGDFIQSPLNQPENIAEPLTKTDNKVLVRQLNTASPLQISIAEIIETESPTVFERLMLEENETDALPEEELPEQAEKGLSIENIAVTLRVELEARRLGLEEAANLRVNQVLDLGVFPTDAVNLFINDKLVGRGEIVEVENRLGVRIIKLLH